jgi:hypothetical protein
MEHAGRRNRESCNEGIENRTGISSIMRVNQITSKGFFLKKKFVQNFYSHMARRALSA